LRKLGNSARILGGSAGILSASTRLRERLGRVLHLFRQNAESLYPEKIQEHAGKTKSRVKPVRSWRMKNFLNHTMRDRKPRVQTTKDPKNAVNLALEFRKFSEDVGTLFECFSQFPEFVEELPDWSIAEEINVCLRRLSSTK
jgi:WD repeat-containing protein 26